MYLRYKRGTLGGSTPLLYLLYSLYNIFVPPHTVPSYPSCASCKTCTSTRHILLVPCVPLMYKGCKRYNKRVLGVLVPLKYHLIREIVTRGTRRVRGVRGSIRVGKKMYNGYKRYNKGVQPYNLPLLYLLYMREISKGTLGLRKVY